MTAQEPDRVLFRGRWWAVTAVDGAGLFNPAEYGLLPISPHTACWRGWVCGYVVRDGALILRELSLGSRERPPDLRATPARRRHFEWRYQALSIPVAFTGRMLLGAGDVADRPHLNMGYWPAWMYARVFEVGFDDGALRQAVDRSADLAGVRSGLGGRGGRRAEGETVEAWIERTFSCSFDYSWPRERR